MITFSLINRAIYSGISIITISIYLFLLSFVYGCAKYFHRTEKLYGRTFDPSRDVPNCGYFDPTVHPVSCGRGPSPEY